MCDPVTSIILRRISGRSKDSSGTSSPWPQNGKCIGPYVLGNVLGVGSTCHVHLGTDPINAREVAIKLLLGTYEKVRPLAIREAHTMALLRHENIVSVYGLVQVAVKSLRFCVVSRQLTYFWRVACPLRWDALQLSWWNMRAEEVTLNKYLVAAWYILKFHYRKSPYSCTLWNNPMSFGAHPQRKPMFDANNQRCMTSEKNVRRFLYDGPRLAKKRSRAECCQVLPSGPGRTFIHAYTRMVSQVHIGDLPTLSCRCLRVLGWVDKHLKRFEWHAEICRHFFPRNTNAYGAQQLVIIARYLCVSSKPVLCCSGNAI